jgi:hypothetical protein
MYVTLITGSCVHFSTIQHHVHVNGDYEYPLGWTGEGQVVKTIYGLSLSLDYTG